MAKKMRKSRRKIITALATVVALSAAVGTARAITSSDSDHYRVATAQLGSVTQTVSTTGTVASATRYDVSFAVAGTVDSVNVAVGDEVAAGDVIATLDEEELVDAVSDARTALADAKETLSDALEAQADGTTIQVESGSNGSIAANAVGATSSEATTVAATYVKTSRATTASVASATTSSVTTAAQDAAAVTAEIQNVAATSDLDSALETYRQAQKDVQSAQDALLAKYDEIVQESASTDDDVESTTSPAGACAAFLAISDPEDEDAVTYLEQCQTLIRTAQDSLGNLATQYDELQGLVDDLNTKVAALDTAATALAAASENSDSDDDQTTSDDQDDSDSTSGSQDDTKSNSDSKNSDNSAGQPDGGDQGANQPGASDQDTSQPGQDGGNMPGDSSADNSQDSGQSGMQSGSDGSSAGGQSGSASGVEVTAERIVAYRAAVSVAKAELAAAKQAKKLGTLTAPIAGRVAQVTMEQDQQVSAQDSSAVITILGDDGYVISTSMGLNDVQLLEVGQTFTGTAAGAPDGITGTVAAIGIENQSSSATPSYSVELSVDPLDESLHEQSMASVDIVVSEVSDVLTVPTSAVTRTGNQASVTVLEDGSAVQRDVEVGAMGTELTEITSGIDEGQSVVLADLTQPVTSDEEESSGSLSDLGGDDDDADRGGQGFGSFGGGGGGGMPPSFGANT